MEGGGLPWESYKNKIKKSWGEAYTGRGIKTRKKSTRKVYTGRRMKIRKIKARGGHTLADISDKKKKKADGGLHRGTYTRRKRTD